MEEVTVLERVGAGGFAEVYRGNYRGTDVAVKKLLRQPGAEGARAVAAFKKEVALMTRLRHPNIVLFMGVIAEPLCLVTEFCNRGNLFELLHNDAAASLTWKQRLHIALDSARGMNFLHASKPPIIHRDLKSLNILVDEHMVAKVADFGLSRFKRPAAAAPAGHADAYMTAQAGSWNWMAPEVMAGGDYDERADLYSFGIILWELLTLKVPFAELRGMQVALAVLNRSERPPMPESAPKEFADLIERCWSKDPAARPSFAVVIPLLQTLEKEAHA